MLGRNRVGNLDHFFQPARDDNRAILVQSFERNRLTPGRAQLDCQRSLHFFGNRHRGGYTQGGGHLVVLGISVKDDGGLLFALAVTAFVGSAVVLALRRTDIPVVGRYFELAS